MIRLLSFASLMLAVCHAVAQTAVAQTYPGKPIRIISPVMGGVADYTRLLVAALAERLGTIHVWAPEVSGAELAGQGVMVHRVAGFGPRSLQQISEGLAASPGPRRLFVQYVPTAFGFRGMNVPLVRWLVAEIIRRRRGASGQVEADHQRQNLGSRQRRANAGPASVDLGGN